MADKLVYTSAQDISDVHGRLHKTFASGITRPLEWRRQQLHQLIRMFQENKKAIEHALWLDLRKPDQESALMEVAGVIGNAKLALNNLEEWTASVKPPMEPSHRTWNAVIHQVPKGVVVIISPWNYPFTLTFKPLVGAIAAGCAVVLKPSEVTASCAALMAELVPKYLEPSAFIVVNGAAPETTALLSLRWDHIMYTGGVDVGRIVAAAAAKYVTPVTLELGGKSPVVVDAGYDLDLAARRILFGKAQNAGQLCVSPDYTVVLRSVYADFLEALQRTYKSFWPSGAFAPNTKWGKIVSERHAERLLKLIEATKGKILIGGKHEQLEDGVRIEPTIVTEVRLDDVLMGEEIFGPIHPVIAVDTIEDAIQIIRSLPKTLTVYGFTNSEETKKKLLEQTDSGTLQFGDTVSMLGADEIPFGGRGDSGYGAWHGWWSFKTFSQDRAQLDIPASEEPKFAARYYPYTKEKYDLMSSLCYK
ncbi:Aldehyde/histidinol dehydrogenase [Cytidiella melzeri]|nr:Aldehyde/histidinol dehydrogenase [Cytidiella melzeri]